MEFKAHNIPGVFEIELFHAIDERGSFTKTLHKNELEKHGLNAHFAESYFSVNHKNVIRGMASSK